MAFESNHFRVLNIPHKIWNSTHIDLPNNHSLFRMVSNKGKDKSSQLKYLTLY